MYPAYWLEVGMERFGRIRNRKYPTATPTTRLRIIPMTNLLDNSLPINAKLDCFKRFLLLSSMDKQFLQAKVSSSITNFPSQRLILDD